VTDLPSSLFSLLVSVMLVFSGQVCCSDRSFFQQCAHSGRTAHIRQIRAILPHVVSTDDSERKKDEAWANLCRAEGWVCRVCGSVPERGQRFTDNLCDDCRKIVRNE
jgi:hypothetical protein